MKLGIISDTHDQLESIIRVIDLFKKNNIKKIYHCGDWIKFSTVKYFFSLCPSNIPLTSVVGNNQFNPHFIQQINKQSWNINIKQNFNYDIVEDLKIAVYHGHINKKLNSLLTSQRYDLVCSGHTHIAKVEIMTNTIHINPGTTADRVRSSHSKKPTCCIFDTVDKSSEILQL